MMTWTTALGVAGVASAVVAAGVEGEMTQLGFAGVAIVALSSTVVVLWRKYDKLQTSRHVEYKELARQMTASLDRNSSALRGLADIINKGR